MPVKSRGQKGNLSQQGRGTDLEPDLHLDSATCQFLCVPGNLLHSSVSQIPIQPERSKATAKSTLQITKEEQVLKIPRALSDKGRMLHKSGPELSSPMPVPSSPPHCSAEASLSSVLYERQCLWESLENRTGILLYQVLFKYINIYITGTGLVSFVLPRTLQLFRACTNTKPGKFPWRSGVWGSIVQEGTRASFPKQED